MHHIFKVFSLQGLSETSTECWAFFLTVLWLLNSLQTEQRAVLYTKILILGKFVKILKFINNA